MKLFSTIAFAILVVTTAFFGTVANSQTYCNPTYDYACSSNDYINNFSFNTLSKQNSGCNGNTDNYIYDLTTTTTVQAGGAYTMSMQSGQVYAQSFGVWIDYNNDGDFAEADEFVYASPNSSMNVFLAYIAIPTTATPGLTRLRVRCNYGGAVSAIDSCSIITYGETEDYNITITQPPTCVNPPNPGNAIASKTTLCDANTVFYLKLNGCPNGLGQSYQWEQSTDGTNWSDISGATARAISQTISVTTHFRCRVTCTGTATSTEVVVSIAAPLTLSFTSVDVTCPGLNNGSITATVGGGTAPYTYNWQEQQGGIANPSHSTMRKKEKDVIAKYGEIKVDSFPNASTINNLYANGYDLIVTDANGCTISGSQYVNQPSSIFLQGNSLSANCGSSDGAASVTPSGGTLQYTYLWQGGSTNDTISAVAAGIYKVVVSDSNNCRDSISVAVSNLTSPVLTFTVTNVICQGGTNGEATVFPTLGNPPYTYSWTTVPVQTTINATGLKAGKYFVTVTDPAGCKAIKDTTIYQPDSLKSGAYTYSVTCRGICNGSIYTGAYGGNYPYTYLWNNGSTESFIDTLCAGNYTVTITDINMCTVTDVKTVTEPLPITATSTQNNVSCFGLCNGKITATATGGKAPYLYNWAPLSSTTNVASGLCIGNYSVIVSDSDTCGAKDTVFASITQPPVLTSTITASTSTNCFGSNNGTATASGIGGTSPYSYLWTQGNQTTQTASNLSVGTNSVQVTDAKGCVASTTVTITQPTLLTSTVSASTPVNCFGGSDGAATAGGIGGTAPYSYYWLQGNQTTQSANNLVAGTNSVQVTDAKGCVSNSTVTITQASAITTTLTSTSASCYATCTGTASALASGGTGPYSYLWMPSAGITQTASFLCAGLQTVIVSDSKNCTAIDTISVLEPLPVPVTVTSTPTSCGSLSGTAIANVSGSGAFPPFSYLWTTGSTSASIGSLDAGIYRVNVTDNKGCFGFADAMVTSSNGPSIATTNINDVSCFGLSNGLINITVTGGAGPYTYLWSNGKTTEDISSLSKGPYEIKVIDANACLAVKTISVNEPLLLTHTPTIINSGCSASNGSISIQPLGGNAPYFYSWSTGGSTSAQTGLSANIYSLTITDSKGCIDSTLLAVQDSGGPVVFVDTVLAASCGTTGFVFIAPMDSNSIASYNWSNGSTGQNLLGAGPGNYGVVITDTSGCKSVLITPIFPVLPPIKPICLVTVDTITNQNIIVWEKPISSFIAGFNIYRESSQQGIYQKIGFSTYTTVSTYYDPIADPSIKWARYKISMVDVCGIEGISSPDHKTIHLSIQSTNADTTNLIWDAYVGYPISGYNIFRKDSSAGYWYQIGSVPANTTKYLDDTFPHTGDTISYHVDVDHPGGDCIATIKNPEPMATSVKSGKSNADNRITNPASAVEEISASTWMSIYPNPNSGTFTLLSTKHSITGIIIYNTLGEIVYNQKVDSKKIDVSIPSKSKGVYHVQVRTTSGVINKKIVISQ